MPSFSRDGRWIYFSSDRTGRSEIWRIETASGSEERLTEGGGQVPFASFDARTLYYLDASNALMARGMRDGVARQILPCINSRSFAVGPKGIFHIDCDPGNDASSCCRARGGATLRELRYWDEATGRDRPIATLDAPSTAHLACSADGRRVLYDRGNVGDTDLMMIENLR